MIAKRHSRRTEEDLFQLAAASAPPYSASALVYDHMMKEVDYKSWAKYLIMLMTLAGKKSRRSQVHGETLCDYACGTGNISFIMSRLGYDVTGVDRSEEMLRIAGEKLSKNRKDGPRFICYDMTNYVSADSFDRAICVYDSINYIHDTAAIVRFFKSVYRSLKPGGVFVFDASMESNSLGDASLFVQRGVHKGLQYQRKSEYDPTKKTHTTLVRIKKDGRVFEEIHQECVYQLATLRELFGQAGFEEKFAAGDFTMLEANEQSERVHFVLLKGDHD
ncbi:MAG: class I SAM-dependent methyltransferase [Bacteroidetes bacterium]|nr:class I SAM-dependent methyltransferase [Bacteroidota bacterium]